MLFDKNDERTNERVLYKTKPNMILGCKKAIFGIVLLVAVFMVSPKMIQFIGKMQVYMISQIQLPLTRYTAIAFFVIILIIILFVIWQILGWYSIEYALTDSRIIIKSGILSTKKNYMPYSAIQDINTSQSVIARLFNVGSVSVFSAYDNNLMEIKNVSNPSKVEEIIFSHMMGIRNFQEPPRNFQEPPRNFQEPPRNFIDRNADVSYSQNVSNEGYYDEYEPITPIGHERTSRSRREYEYYPEDFSYREERANRYEYEPYGDELDRNMGRAINNSNDNIRYEGMQNVFSNSPQYNESRDDYPQSGEEDYYQYNESRDDYPQSSDDYYQYDEVENHYDESVEETYQNEPEQVAETRDSSEKVIRRHFDKFKK